MSAHQDFHPWDGHRFLSSGIDNAIKIWSLAPLENVIQKSYRAKVRNGRRLGVYAAPCTWPSGASTHRIGLMQSPQRMHAQNMPHLVYPLPCLLPCPCTDACLMQLHCGCPVAHMQEGHVWVTNADGTGGQLGRAFPTRVVQYPIFSTVQVRA